MMAKHIFTTLCGYVVIDKIENCNAYSSTNFTGSILFEYTRGLSPFKRSELLIGKWEGHKR